MAAVEKTNTLEFEDIQPIKLQSLESFDFTEEEAGAIEETIETPVKEVPIITSNLESMVQKCNSLCGSDSKNYCTQENEVIF
jgi:hypothetical protein